MANCIIFGGRSAGGGGVGVSRGLAKNLCPAAVRRESTKSCSGYWGLQNGLLRASAPGESGCGAGPRSGMRTGLVWCVPLGCLDVKILCSYLWWTR